MGGGGYALTFGGFLMLGGRLADVAGRRRMFLTGLVLFVAASILGGFSRSGGILALAYGVTEATGRGFASTKVLIALALSAALLIAFVVVEKNSSQPLLPGRMLRLRSVVAGNGVMGLLMVVMIGAIFFNSLYLQEILG